MNSDLQLVDAWRRTSRSDFGAIAGEPKTHQFTCVAGTERPDISDICVTCSDGRFSRTRALVLFRKAASRPLLILWLA